MRSVHGAVIALCVIACAAGAGCNPKGGGSAFPAFVRFPQAFGPVTLAASGGSGDAWFEANGDLIAVGGSATVTRVAKSDGAITSAASNVGGGATVLLSVAAGADGTIYAGDAAGVIHAIDAAGVSSVLVDTGADPVVGLAPAPGGFGSFGGSIVAALGPGGLVVVDPAAETPAPTTLTAGTYDDLAFSGTTLFALDGANAEIDQVASDGTPTSFATGFVDPVGVGVDPLTLRIYVADAGDDVLRSLSVAGGAPIDVAPYDFSPSPPSGIAFDSFGGIAFVTAGSVVLRTSTVPPLQQGLFGFSIGGSTVGYGDLELDHSGQLVAVSNDDVGDPDNAVLVAARDGTLTALAVGIGVPGEDLLGLAYEPFERTVYVGTELGNVFRIDASNRVELLVAATPNVPLLGLELAPSGFGAFGGFLIATTADGRVLAIDPASPAAVATIATIATATVPSEPAALPDLVFGEDGTLYVLDSGIAQVSQATPVPRILTVAAGGVVADLGVSPALLGLPDGLALDPGAPRLLVASGNDVAGDQLLEVPLVGAPTPVALATIDIDDGFFPTGVVYDGLGGAAIHGGSNATTLLVAPTFGP